MSARFVLSAAAAYSIVGVIERGLALLVMPLTTRILTPADVAQLIAIANLTTLLIHLGAFFFVRGLPAVLARGADEAARHEIASTVFWATAASTAATGALAWLAAPSIGTALKQPAHFVELLRLGLAGMMVTAVGYILMVLARSIERHELAVKVQAVALVLQTSTMLLLLVGAGWGPASVLVASLVSGVLVVTAYAASLGRDWLGAVPTWTPLRQASVMSLHLLALQIGPLIMMNCAGLILNFSGRSEEAALMSIASGAAGVALLSAASFEGVWTAYVLRRRSDPGLPALAGRIFELHSAAFLVIGCFGAVFAHEVFAILVGPRFVEGYGFVPPLIGCYALLSFAQGFGQGMQMGERPQRFAWIGIVTTTIYVSLGLLAAGPFGAAGLLAAMALALVVMIVLIQRHSHEEFPVTYPWGRHAALWALGSVLTASVAYLPLGWTAITAKIAVVLVVAACALLTARLGLRDVLVLIESLGWRPLGGR